MSDNTQHGSGFYVSGGDLTMRNYGGSDIPAGSVVLMDTTSGNKMGVVIPTSSGAVTGAVGIAVDVLPAGKTGRVRVYGVGVCTANGTITRGDSIQASNTASKLGWAKTATTATTSIGMALTNSVDGDPVLVLISRALNALYS